MRYHSRKRLSVEDNYRDVVDFMKDDMIIELRLSGMTNKEVNILRNKFYDVVTSRKHSTVRKYIEKELGESFIVGIYQKYLLINMDCDLRTIGAR